MARSDAFEMILHHLVTIALILLSYLTRFSRIGSSILLVHDFADIFLEIGKCFNYICKSRDDKVGKYVEDWFMYVCMMVHVCMYVGMYVNVCTICTVCTTNSSSLYNTCVSISVLSMYVCM